MVLRFKLDEVERFSFTEYDLCRNYLYIPFFQYYNKVSCLGRVLCHEGSALHVRIWL